MAPPSRTVLPSKKPIKQYTVDCSAPAKDGILNTCDFVSKSLLINSHNIL